MLCRCVEQRENSFVPAVRAPETARFCRENVTLSEADLVYGLL